MTSSLLASLRENVLDESQSLAGLLRKCLMLGAETGSDSLRQWARLELSGYPEDAPLPDYRKITGAVISVDSQSGNTWMTGQLISRIQIPPEAREYVPEELYFRQPMEELARLAESNGVTLGSPGLAMAQSIWNGKLNMFQKIVSMHYKLSSSVVSGILGQVRTRLVDVVADLTASTPLRELPNKSAVDAAVLERIQVTGDNYNTTINAANGPVAIGAGATAKAGLTVEEVLELLQEAKQQADDNRDIEPEIASEFRDAIQELQDVVQRQEPQRDEVERKVGKLRSALDKIGDTVLTTSAASATSALLQLASSGAFG